MMKKVLLLVTMICSGVSLKAQNYIHLVTEKYDYIDDPSSTNAMTERIKKGAEYYAKNALVPRFAEMDFAFGANQDEYKKLNGYGVLYVSSLNQDSTEYPIKRVYFKSGNTVIELQKIIEIQVPTSDATIKKVFGKNRVDYYYLIPYSETQLKNELLIDWSANRKDFVLGKFPTDNKLDYDVDDLKSTDNKTINSASLDSFLKREFGVKLFK